MRSGDAGTTSAVTTMPGYRKLTVATTVPVIHRVLVPLNVFYVYGYYGRSVELPVIPMLWLGRQLVAILLRCIAERVDARRAGSSGLDAHLVAAAGWPPPGIDVDWLRGHGECTA
jgi:hypothetical protein